MFGELLEATQPATAELGSGSSPCARRRLCPSTLGGLAASVFLLWTNSLLKLTPGEPTWLSAPAEDNSGLGVCVCGGGSAPTRILSDPSD